MSISIVFSYFIGSIISFKVGSVFATTCLLLSIADISESILLRLKSLFLHLITILLISISTVFFAQFTYSIFLYLLVLVLVVSYIQYFLVYPNRFLLVSLLAFTFHISDDINILNLFELSEYIILSGGVYILIVLLSFILYTIFKKSKYSYIFYLEDEEKINSDYIIDNEISNVHKRFKLNEVIEGSILLSHPFRFYFSLSLGYFLMINYDLKLGYWILITVVTLHKPLNKATFKRMFQRVLGTLIGLFIISFLIFYMNQPYQLYFLLFITSWMIFITIQKDYLVAVTFITMVVILLISLSNSFENDMLITRFNDTIIGVAIVILIQTISLFGRKIFDKK